jgi:hypothetical protein
MNNLRVGKSLYLQEERDPVTHTYTDRASLLPPVKNENAVGPEIAPHTALVLFGLCVAGLYTTYVRCTASARRVERDPELEVTMDCVHLPRAVAGRAGR